MLRYPWGLETAHHQKQLSYDNVIAGKKGQHSVYIDLFVVLGVSDAFPIFGNLLGFCGVWLGFVGFGLGVLARFWELVRILWELVRFYWELNGVPLDLVGQILGIS